MRPVKIACLPIGKEWTESQTTQVEGLLNALPECIAVEKFEPAVDEIEVLGRIEAIAEVKSDLLLIAAIHGGSARALTLAGARSKVPVAVWCHDEKHSLASSALASEALRQLGRPHVLLHGNDAASELIAAARAAAALRRLSDARIGHIGPVHFNLVSADLNPIAITSRFGAWVVPVAISDLCSRLSLIEPVDIEKEVECLRCRYEVSVDDVSLRKAVGMHLALAGIAKDNGLDVIAIDCWNEVVPEFGVSPCLGFARDDYRIACEGDVVLALTLLAGEAICGQPGYVGDLYSFDEETGEAMFMHCSGCAGLHSGPELMEIARQAPPGPAGHAGAVVACRPMLPQGPATMALLHGERLEYLHVRPCEILRTGYPEQMHVHIRVKGDPASFRKEASGNHYVVFPGDTAEAWHIWAEWAGVQVH